MGSKAARGNSRLSHRPGPAPAGARLPALAVVLGAGVVSLEVSRTGAVCSIDVFEEPDVVLHLVPFIMGVARRMNDESRQNG